MNPRYLIIALLALCAGTASAAPQASLNDVARYLAGYDVSSDSPLAAQQKAWFYAAHKNGMQAYWKQYERTTVTPIRAFQQKWLANENRETCFYPFAGGDFVNAYLFYPNASTYVMIGLETAGLVPDVPAMAQGNVRTGLDFMLRGYRVFINFNFYRTYSMQVDMEKSPFTGTIPHILNQMAWLGLKPVAAYEVGVTAAGTLTFKPLAQGKYVKRAAIDCVDSAGKMRRVIYMFLDLENNKLRAEPHWWAYLQNLGQVSGFLKAASYLCPRPEHVMIRELCLKLMPTIVQDDSGIPYKYLKDYNVTVFGKYQGPHAIFPSYHQPELLSVYRSAPYRAQDFNFSYDRSNGWRNVMVAIRK